MKTDRESVLVVGAGNLGLGSAAHCSNLGNKVLVYTRRKISLAKSKIIHSTGSVAHGSHSIYDCSTELSELADRNGGNLPRRTIICCRSNDLEDIGGRLASYVRNEMDILLICSGRFASVMFSKILRNSGVADNDLPAIADFETSPFVSRGNADNTINISAFKNEINIAAQTPELTARVLKSFIEEFPNLCPVSSSLELNLHKCDDLVHTPLVLTGWINLESGCNHNIYTTATKNTTNLIIQLDEERLAIGRKVDIELVDMATGYHESYGTLGPSLLEHFHQNSAYANASVQDVNHRFLFEDVPFGAVPLQSVARLVGVKTPLLDACITFSYALLNLPSPWLFQAEDIGL